MEIWEEIPSHLEKCALCIGKFDGFHKGHRVLIDEAKDTGYPVACLTFLFGHGQMIDDREQKRRIAESLGVDFYIEVEAGPKIFSMTPEVFIKDVVSEKLHAKHIIVGEDFRFGRDRSGDITTLSEYEAKYGYVLHAVPKLKDGGKDISSSRIREHILAGQMEDVKRLLCRAYTMEGIVKDGNHIGRDLGFPTANLSVEKERITPPYGVYVTDVRIEDRVYNGIGNLGVKPTVGSDNAPGLEVHIFDYEGDLYGKRISVGLESFLRKEKRFDDLKKLHAQIEEDIRRAKSRRL